MPGLFDASHCGTCGSCTPPCEIFNYVGVTDYTIDFVEFAGTWSYGSSGGFGYAETSTTTTGIYNIHPVQADTPWVLESEFELTLDDTGDCQWRLAVGSDASNYVHAQVDVRIIGGEYYLQLSVGGTADGIVTTPTNTDMYSLGAVGSSGSLRTFKVTLCWDDDGHLNASIATPSSASAIWLITFRDIVPPGLYSGVFATVIRGTLRFTKFLFKHSFHVEETPSCIHCVQSCAVGSPLSTIQVKFEDSSPTGYQWRDAYNFPGDFEDPPFLYPACILDCSQLIGTHVLTQSTVGVCDFSGSGTEITGIHLCRWFVDLDGPFDNTPDCGVYDNKPSGQQVNDEKIRIVAYFTYDTADIFGTNRYMNIEVYYYRDYQFVSDACELIAKYKGLVDGYMADWADVWQNIPFVYLNPVSLSKYPCQATGADHLLASVKP